MAKLFSKRSRPDSERLRTDIPDLVRSRILHVLRDLRMEVDSNFDYLLEEVGAFLKREYGGLVGPHGFVSQGLDPVVQHFFSCDDVMALDFIEACFLVFHNPGQRGVDAINNIFEDEGIAYYLTPYVETLTDEPVLLHGHFLGGKKMEIQHPQIIRRDSEFVRKEMTAPALTLLSDARYRGANQEFLQAHKHYRDGDYKSVLNECLKAFESVMKIIGVAKKWPFNQTDTAKTLIKTCLDNKLVPTFSDQQLTSLRVLLESGVPTTRNKQGGHGQGVQIIDVPPELARYTLNLTAATILLLVESAKL